MYKKPIIHKGENGCMSVALYQLKKPEPNSLVFATDIELLKGGHPKVGEPIICGTCGQGLHLISVEGWCK